jgi:thymidylate kinase
MRARTVADVQRIRLIAVDGAQSSDVAAATEALVESLSARHQTVGSSRFDASGLFGDLVAAAPEARTVSPRTLILLYAADLAFRLRWEIAPALENGAMVIAAPYVATATAFGLAAGLPADWLRTLFEFAPVPGSTVVLRDRNPDRVWKRRPDRGFCECCTTVLELTPGGFSRRKVRAAMSAALTAIAGQHGGPVRKRDLEALADSLLKPVRRRARDRRAASSPNRRP